MDPDFAANRRLYTCHAWTDGVGRDVRVVAWTVDAAFTTAVRVANPLFAGMPVTSGRHAGCREPRRGAPSPTRIAQPVLLEIAVVRVPGTERVDEIAVVPAPGIFVPDQEGDRGTGGLTFENTREDLDGIGFLPLRDVTRSARLAPVEVPLNLIDGEGETGRTTIDNTADRRTVALAK